MKSCEIPAMNHPTVFPKWIAVCAFGIDLVVRHYKLARIWWLHTKQVRDFNKQFYRR